MTVGWAKADYVIHTRLSGEIKILHWVGHLQNEGNANELGVKTTLKIVSLNGTILPSVVVTGSCEFHVLLSFPLQRTTIYVIDTHEILTVSGLFSKISLASSLLHNSSMHSLSRFPFLLSSMKEFARRFLSRNWEAYCWDKTWEKQSISVIIYLFLQQLKNAVNTEKMWEFNTKFWIKCLVRSWCLLLFWNMWGRHSRILYVGAVSDQKILNLCY